MGHIPLREPASTWPIARAVLLLPRARHVKRLGSSSGKSHAESQIYFDGVLTAVGRTLCPFYGLCFVSLSD